MGPGFGVQGGGGHEFFESFDDGLDAHWIRYGVRGEGDVIDSPRGRVAQLTAGARIGSEVGKACLVHEFPAPLGLGDTLDVAASFLVPALAGGRISLIDIECKYCGVPIQPGIRLFVDVDRTIYLERGKLGIDGVFRQRDRPTVPVSAWCDLHWHIRFGHGEDGECTLWLDGKPVLAARGANFPDRRIARRLGVGLTAEQYDRVQIGLTANSQPQAVTILLDDIEIVAGRPGGVAAGR